MLCFSSTAPLWSQPGHPLLQYGGRTRSDQRSKASAAGLPTKRTAARLSMPMRARINLYQKLGLDKSASPAEISHAYRTFAKVYHPDGTAPDDVMAKAFVEIAAAAEILRDPKKRRLYDQGYIDDFGEWSSAGRGREQRRRSLRVFGSVLALSFIVALPIAMWGAAGMAPRTAVQTTAKAEPDETKVAPLSGAKVLPTSSGADRTAQNTRRASAPATLSIPKAPSPIQWGDVGCLNDGR